MSLPSSDRHCTVLYIVKAEIRSHNCWFLPVESVHAAVNISNEERVQFFVSGFPFEITHSSNFRRDCNNNWAICLWSARFDAFKSPRSRLQCCGFVSLSLSALSGGIIWLKKQDKHYSEQENSHCVVYTVYVGTKNKHLPECGASPTLRPTAPSHSETMLVLLSSSAERPAAVCWFRGPAR